MNPSQKVFKNFISLFSGEVLGKFFSLLLYIYIANKLGVTSFGELSFATAYISFYNIFADFGLTMLGIREITRDKSKTNIFGTNILLIQILIVLVLFLILSISLIFIPIDLKLKIITIIFGLRMIPLAFDMSYIFQAHEKMEYVFTSKVISQLIYLLLGLFLISISNDIISMPISLLVGSTIGTIISYIFLKNKLQLLIQFHLLDKLIVKNFLYTSIPLFSASILAGVYSNLDAIMIQFMENSDQVGYYSSGYKIVNALTLFIVFIANAYFPLISNNFKSNIESFHEHSINFAKSMGITSIPLAVILFLYSKDIMLFIYRKQEFVNGVDALKILTSLIILFSFNTLISNIIISADNQKYNFYSVVVAVVTNLILNFLLIPKYGIIGASYSIVIAEIFATGYLAIFYSLKMKRLLKLIQSFSLKPIIACIPIFFIYKFVDNFILGIIINAFLYLIVLFTIKGFDFLIPQIKNK